MTKPKLNKIDVTLKYVGNDRFAVTLEGTSEQIEMALTSEFGNALADALDAGTFEKLGTKN